MHANRDFHFHSTKGKVRKITAFLSFIHHSTCAFGTRAVICMHLCLCKTLSQDSPHGKIRHLPKSIVFVKSCPCLKLTIRRNSKLVLFPICIGLCKFLITRVWSQKWNMSIHLFEKFLHITFLCIGAFVRDVLIRIKPMG